MIIKVDGKVYSSERTPVGIFLTAEERLRMVQIGLEDVFVSWPAGMDGEKALEAAKLTDKEIKEVQL